MKKILTIIFTIFAVVFLAGCTGGVNYRMKVEEGDIRKTYTNEYVLTEICNGSDGFGTPTWDKVAVEKIDSLSLIMKNNYK
jgi:hypothetical protein